MPPHNAPHPHDTHAPVCVKSRRGNWVRAKGCFTLSVPFPQPPGWIVLEGSLVTGRPPVAQATSPRTILKKDHLLSLICDVCVCVYVHVACVWCGMCVVWACVWHVCVVCVCVWRVCRCVWRVCVCVACGMSVRPSNVGRGMRGRTVRRAVVGLFPQQGRQLGVSID